MESPDWEKLDGWSPSVSKVVEIRPANVTTLLRAFDPVDSAS